MRVFVLFFFLLCFAKQVLADSILVVTGSHSNAAKMALMKKHLEAQKMRLEIISAKSLSEGDVQAKFSSFNLILFAGVSVRDSQKSFSPFAANVKALDKQFLALSWPNEASLVKNINAVDVNSLVAYFENGGDENFRRMALFIQKRLFEQDSSADIKSPIVFPTQGIYHAKAPQKVFGDLDSYLKWKGISSLNTKPVVGVMFTRNSIESADTALIDETVERLEKKGATPLAFFSELRPNSPSYLPLLQNNEKTIVDVVLNFRNIHWASARKTEFEALGVPIMQALVYFDGDQQQWESNDIGISPNMTPFQLVLPEAAGVIDPWIVAANNRVTQKTQIIDYQLDHMVDKSLKVANLHHKANSEKKVSVMVWGSRDVGASFMNVPESISSIASRLNKEQYTIPAISASTITENVDDILDPFYRNYELQALLDKDLAELMPVEGYLSWFNTLPSSVQDPINEYWGKAQDNFMVLNINGKPQFVIPRIRMGNMLVMRQPPRADDDDEDKRIYHKGTVPMNHYYLAAYYYVRQYWGSDAIIHLGTHGSQEYLPGKERGLSLYDQGNLAVWDTPVIYPFIVDDVGEAMQTKRRGRATVISHMTPPFAAAGLQGQIAYLHELMHQYKSLDEGGVKEKTGEFIVEICHSEEICKDIAWTDEDIRKDFDLFVEELHVYLDDLAIQNQPLGLHTFGELPEEKLISSTLVQMLGREFVAQAASLENNGKHDEHAMHVQNHAENNDLESIIGYATVKQYIIDGMSADALDKPIQEAIIRGRDLYQGIKSIRELDHLVDALNGAYIPVKTGGDPIRHPNSLPTGDNLYGFDPARVPTKAAYEQGRELTEKAIADFYQQHGHYPDKLAFSLWSMETMRHYGVLEAQVLAAIGMKPKWSRDGRVIGTEKIEARELKRPRVDVVLSATGLYRDAFPNVLQFLAKALREIAELREANNSIWDHAQALKTELIENGIDEGEAEYLSSVRIFSNESGTYGSGLGDAAVASDTWETDAKLADLYLSRMGYYYGDDSARWGQKAPANVDLYRKQLSGTDMVMFSRSSNVFGLLSSDDPFQYFGGIALAIRNIDGKSPQMLISNLRDPTNARMESAAKFMAKDLRSRAFHERWVKEMKKEGYSGAVSMASTVSNFFGWQVMNPNLVRGDQWQEFFEVYVKDKFELEMDAWFEEVDPKAHKAMIEHMLEAVRKDYWQANEQTLKTLIERYQELVQRFDLVVDNEKLREFADQQAQGFGLDLKLPSPEKALATDIAQTRQVEGQKLEKVEPSASTDKTEWLNLMFAIVVIFIGIGIFRQLRWSPERLQSHPV